MNQKLFKFILTFILTYIPPLIGFSLSPMVQYQDLIAGNGSAGFRDGPFYSSKFDQPQGLAVSQDGKKIYVADTRNNRIRVIDLENRNNVQTLAGTGIPGKLDGPCSTALFNHPACVAILSGDRLVVFDQGTLIFRLIDLKKKIVSTLVPADKDGAVNDLDSILGDVWSVVYAPNEGCLYYSEPAKGALRKINLKTRLVEVVLKNNPQVPYPKALCAVNGKLYVSDAASNSIYEITQKNDGKTESAEKSSASIPASLNLVGTGTAVMELAASNTALYALQNGEFSIVRISPPGTVDFVSLSGEKLVNPGVADLLEHFRGFDGKNRIGFVPDPGSNGKFYISNYADSTICSFRDLNFGYFDVAHGEDMHNLGGLHDFDYPYAKPPKTFRILILGRCYLYWVANSKMFEQKNMEGDQNYLKAVAKQMEFALNTKAALEDWPCHFEVLNGGMHAESNCLEFWPYYVIPKIAKKYDVDLVVSLHDDGINFFDPYFDGPITSEGIPQADMDSEFYLKPNSEKFKSGPMRDFIQMVESHNKNLNSSNISAGVLDADFEDLISTPEVRSQLMELMQTPLKLLKQKFESLVTSQGKPCRFITCYFPVHMFTGDDQRDFFKSAYEKAGIPFIDLCDDFGVLGMSYAPIRSDGINGGHFTAKGMSLFSAILIHELIKNNEIPTKDGLPSN